LTALAETSEEEGEGGGRENATNIIAIKSYSK
jgi:hypothetical protein